MEVTTLGVGSPNAGALRIYQGVGFRARFATRWYAKAFEG